MKLTKPQTQIFKSNKRFKVVVAGRRFGKTVMASIELLKRSIDSPGSVNWYIAPTFQMTKDIGFRTFVSLCPEEYIAKNNQSELTIELINGSLIQFKSADRPDRLRGLGLSFVVLDEASQFDSKVWFESIRPALADKQGSAIIITTPQGVSNWIYDLYQQAIDKANTNWHGWQFTTAEGGNVPPSELEEAKATLDERTFKQEFLASFETVVGLVYYNYNHLINTTLLEPEDFPTIHIGLDFNIQKMAATVATKYRESLYIVDELVDLYDTQEFIDIVYSRFNSWCYSNQVFIYPDASSNQRNTAASLTDLQMLRNSGFNVVVNPANPRVRDRVSTVNSLFSSVSGNNRLFINQQRCPSLHKALLRQTYTDKGEPDKNGDWSHILDALGYVCVGTNGLITPSVRNQSIAASIT